MAFPELAPYVQGLRTKRNMAGKIACPCCFATNDASAKWCAKCQMDIRYALDRLAPPTPVGRWLATLNPPLYHRRPYIRGTVELTGLIQSRDPGIYSCTLWKRPDTSGWQGFSSKMVRAPGDTEIHLGLDRYIAGTYTDGDVGWINEVTVSITDRRSGTLVGCKSFSGDAPPQQVRYIRGWSEPATREGSVPLSAALAWLENLPRLECGDIVPCAGSNQE